MDGGYLRCQHRLDLVPRLDAFDDRQHKAATPRALLYWNRRCANGVFFWVLGCRRLTLVKDSEIRRMTAQLIPGDVAKEMRGRADGVRLRASAALSNRHVPPMLVLK
jgi:hypothetical protein